MAYDSVHQTVVLFGGGTGGLLNYTWIWDGQAWVEEQPSQRPSERARAAMAFDENQHQMVLFGGDGVASSPTDIWLWDGFGWQQSIPSSSPAGDGLESHMVFSTARQALLLFVTGKAVLSGEGRKLPGPSEFWIWQ